MKILTKNMVEEHKEELISSDPSSFTEESEKNDQHDEKAKTGVDHHEAVISILVVNIDYTLTKHSINEQFQALPGNPLQPVIRIFGSAANGQRACLHIHGVSFILLFIFFLKLFFSCLLLCRCCRTSTFDLKIFITLHSKLNKK